MTHLTVEINRLTLAFSDRGTGQPVLLIHGFPLNRQMWTPQVEALSETYRVITPDLRGHGDSAAPLWHYTLEEYADDIKALLDHLEIPRIVLAGLSMGGYVLFAFFRKYPERVRGLILTDTRAQADTEDIREGRFHMAQTAFREGAEPVATAMLPKLLSTPTREGQPSVVSQVRNMIIQNPISGMIVDLMAMAERPDSVPLLHTISCPTLVVVGELDQATPPSDARIMAEGIPGAQLRLIPNAAHLPNLEQPRAFNEAILSYLRSLS